MKRRQLGRSGLWVSEVGLGTNNFGLRDDVDADAVVGAALDSGINFFDTAESYGAGKSEAVLGKALEGRRHEAVIATKWGTTRNPPPGFGSRAYIVRACEASLRRLRTDFIDVYHLHAPDPDVPIAETIRTCEDLVAAGKIRYYALSGSPAWRMVEAQLTARMLGAAGFVATQDHYSLLRRDIVEGERLEVISRYGMSLVPYFPLAGGLLTGKYERGRPFPAGSRFEVLDELSRSFRTEAMWNRAAALGEFARQSGRPLLDLAMSWLLHRPEVASVIAGATSADQIRCNAAAAGWVLAPDQLEAIDALCRE